MSSKLGKITADFSTALSTKISVGGTNLNLQSVLDDDSQYLEPGQYYFTIDGDNSQKEHIICTLSTPTSLLSSISSVERGGFIDETTFTAPNTAGVVREHRVGAVITITDYAHLKAHNDLLSGAVSFNASTPLSYDGDPTITLDAELATKKYADDTFVGLTGNETVAGIKTFSSLPVVPVLPLANTDACSKKYADDLAIAGSPDANLTTKGISEEATAAEIIAGTQTGGTGSELFVNPKYLSDANINPDTTQKTYLTKPIGAINPSVSSSETIIVLSETASMITALVDIPFDISPEHITFVITSALTPAVIKIGIYSEDGQTKELEHTTANIPNAADVITENLSTTPVTISAGKHYITMMPTDTTSIYPYVSIRTWDTDNQFILGNEVVGEAVAEGWVSVGDNTMPATFNPTTDIVYKIQHTGIIRLDN